MFFRTYHNTKQAWFFTLVLMAFCLVVFSPAVIAQGKPAKTEMQQPKLTEYVVNKLSKIKLSNETAPDGKVITYRFVFKKQA